MCPRDCLGEFLAFDRDISRRTEVLPTPIDSTRRAIPAPVAGAPVVGPRQQRGVGVVRVLKFGGSSLATPDRIRAVARIIRQSLDGGPMVVVVSAFEGVTN